MSITGQRLGLLTPDLVKSLPRFQLAENQYLIGNPQGHEDSGSKELTTQGIALKRFSLVSFIEILPKEFIGRILTLVDPKSLVRFATTSTSLRNISLPQIKTIQRIYIHDMINEIDNNDIKESLTLIRDVFLNPEVPNFLSPARLAKLIKNAVTDMTRSLNFLERTPLKRITAPECSKNAHIAAQICKTIDYAKTIPTELERGEALEMAFTQLTDAAGVYKAIEEANVFKNNKKMKTYCYSGIFSSLISSEQWKPAYKIANNIPDAQVKLDTLLELAGRMINKDLLPDRGVILDTLDSIDDPEMRNDLYGLLLRKW